MIFNLFDALLVAGPFAAAAYLALKKERAAVILALLFVLDGTTALAWLFSDSFGMPVSWTDPLRFAYLLTPLPVGLAFLLVPSKNTSKFRRVMDGALFLIAIATSVAAIVLTLRAGCPWTCNAGGGPAYGGAFLAQIAMAPAYLFVGARFGWSGKTRLTIASVPLLLRAALRGGIPFGTLLTTGHWSTLPVMEMPYLGLFIVGLVVLPVVGFRFWFLWLLAILLGAAEAGFASDWIGMLGRLAFMAWAVATPIIVAFLWRMTITPERQEGGHFSFYASWRIESADPPSDESPQHAGAE